MFTGIIETLGQVKAIAQEGTNYHFTIAATITPALQIDQSIAHQGVCLTVVDIIDDQQYVVTAIEETLQKTNLGDWRVGDTINLERCLAMGARLDGHIVQGHVDTTATCQAIDQRDGSWIFTFGYPPQHDGLIIDKGSIAVNGTSLTVINPSSGQFSVAIIPYTYEHTSIKNLHIGTRVNIEFDILGKYILKNLNIKGLTKSIK